MNIITLLALQEGRSFEDLNLVKIALAIAILVICLGIHEAAHGWVAWKCGDSTAKDMGRITLDPLAHIDPFMTIIFPIFFYLSTGFIFGGAKPVPVMFHRLKHPYRDMALVAIAGPASNFLLAIFFALIGKILLTYGIYERTDLMAEVLSLAMGFNILLAAFNLIPLPPLDGSRIMAWLLPASLRPAYVGFERFGMVFLFLLLILERTVTYPMFGFGILMPVLQAIMEPMYQFVTWIVTAGGLW